MPLIEWKKEFETGIDDVDHEHRELVELINELHEKLQGQSNHDAVSEFLGEVFARISAHFALEETVMRKHSYDEYAAHKADHENLLDDIRDIMDAHEDGEFANSVGALSDAVANWFVNHFKTKDARLHKLLGV